MQFSFRRKNLVHGSGHGEISLAVPPQDLVQLSAIGGVGVSEIHAGGLGRAALAGGIGAIDEAVRAIAVVGGKCRLRAGAGEQGRHQGGAGIVVIHGRQADERFHGVDHVDGGIEAMIDRGLIGAGEGRIFTDHQGDGAMRVDVIGAVLGIVFKHEDGRRVQ